MVGITCQSYDTLHQNYLPSDVLVCQPTEFSADVSGSCSSWRGVGTSVAWKDVQKSNLSRRGVGIYNQSREFRDIDGRCGNDDGSGDSLQGSRSWDDRSGEVDQLGRSRRVSFGARRFPEGSSGENLRRAATDGNCVALTKFSGDETPSNDGSWNGAQRVEFLSEDQLRGMNASSATISQGRPHSQGSPGNPSQYRLEERRESFFHHESNSQSFVDGSKAFPEEAYSPTRFGRTRARGSRNRWKWTDEGTSVDGWSRSKSRAPPHSNYNVLEDVREFSSRSQSFPSRSRFDRLPASSFTSPSEGRVANVVSEGAGRESSPIPTSQFGLPEPGTTRDEFFFSGLPPTGPSPPPELPRFSPPQHENGLNHPNSSSTANFSFKVPRSPYPEHVSYATTIPWSNQAAATPPNGPASSQVPSSSPSFGLPSGPPATGPPPACTPYGSPPIGSPPLILPSRPPQTGPLASTSSARPADASLPSDQLPSSIRDSPFSAIQESILYGEPGILGAPPRHMKIRNEDAKRENYVGCEAGGVDGGGGGGGDLFGVDNLTRGNGHNDGVDGGMFSEGFHFGNRSRRSDANNHKIQRSNAKSAVSDDYRGYGGHPSNDDRQSNVPSFNADSVRAPSEAARSNRGFGEGPASDGAIACDLKSSPDRGLGNANPINADPSSDVATVVDFEKILSSLDDIPNDVISSLNDVVSTLGDVGRTPCNNDTPSVLGAGKFVIDPQSSSSSSALKSPQSLLPSLEQPQLSKASTSSQSSLSSFSPPGVSFPEVVSLVYDVESGKARAVLSEFRVASGFSPSIVAKLRRHQREEMRRKVRLLGGDRFRRSKRQREDGVVRTSFGEHSGGVDGKVDRGAAAPGVTKNVPLVKWHFEPNVLPSYEENAARFRRAGALLSGITSGASRSGAADGVSCSDAADGVPCSDAFDVPCSDAIEGDPCSGVGISQTGTAKSVPHSGVVDGSPRGGATDEVTCPSGANGVSFSKPRVEDSRSDVRELRTEAVPPIRITAPSFRPTAPGSGWS